MRCLLANRLRARDAPYEPPLLQGTGYEPFHNCDISFRVILRMRVFLMLLAAFTIMLAARDQHHNGFVPRPTASMPPVDVP